MEIVDRVFMEQEPMQNNLKMLQFWFPPINRFYRFEGFKPSITWQVGERVLASLATGCEPIRKKHVGCTTGGFALHCTWMIPVFVSAAEYHG